MNPLFSHEQLFITTATGKAPDDEYKMSDAGGDENGDKRSKSILLLGRTIGFVHDFRRFLGCLWFTQVFKDLGRIKERVVGFFDDSSYAKNKIVVSGIIPIKQSGGELDYLSIVGHRLGLC